LDISTAQAEMRRAYLRGGPGAIVSGVVWLAAGFAASASSVPIGFAVLFFGGMLIFPAATFILQVILRRDPVSKNNPGAWTVIETIFPMIGGLLAAWLLMPYRSECVFPMAAIAVGTHYFGFRTAYGDWTNWVLGGIICIVGTASMFSGSPDANLVPYMIAAIEIVFGCWFSWNSVSKDD
jgi:hypothetical protein